MPIPESLQRTFLLRSRLYQVVRDFLKAAGFAGLSWLSPVGRLLAQKAEQARTPAHSVILLWMAGGPSHKDTFDLKPGTKDAGNFKPIKTAALRLEVKLQNGFSAGILEWRVK